jgi:hypothetical protein
VSCAPADRLTQTSTLGGAADSEQPAVSVRPWRFGARPVVTIDTVPGTLRIAARNAAASSGLVSDSGGVADGMATTLGFMGWMRPLCLVVSPGMQRCPGERLSYPAA